jgi:DNA invertase Pin-like site-specific DNA recombinase
VAKKKKVVANLVVGYIRVSSEEQAKSGLSLENQEEKIHAYASLHDLEVDEVYRDEGASAKTLRRPGMKTVMGMIKRGEVQTLIIYKLDRMTRSLRDLDQMLSLCQDTDTALVSVTENIDTSSAAGRMVVHMLGVVAQWERETIGERTQAALAVKRSRGEKTGGSVPYGWRVKKGTGVKDKKTGRMIPAVLERDAREDQVVGRMMEWYEKDGIGYTEIARRLNRKGTKSRKGKEWSAQTVKYVVQRVLRDREERRRKNAGL